MPVFTKSARFWTIAFGIWFIVLNILSHGSHLHAPHGWAFDIPHIDKIAHFGYFFGGAGLLSAAYFLSKRPPWKKLILIVTLTISIIGIWDEFHQSFFENRSGNDPYDWLADTLGAFCGTQVFRRFHRKLQ